MLPDAFWLPLIVKIVATASVVVAASIVAERAGPFWGALIACLPVAAGPAYVLLALQADAGFIRDSALIGVAGNAATGLFILVLHRLAPRRRLVPSLLGAVAAWGIAILVVRQWAPWSMPAGVLLNLVVYGGALLMADKATSATTAAASPRWFEMPLRAVTVGLLVAGTVTLSRAIGPAATGLAVAFPISMTSLAIVLHRRLGGAAVALVMANSLKAMPGLGLALLILAEAAVPLGVPTALALGLLVSIGWSLGLMALRTGLPQRRAARTRAL
ncbi:MAG TPA: hypothetical protein VGV37_29605 [Aliidongia sp.]|uniref:hypothetical protein n=1 Tax=Aliidongia sp. TaxID=1914230 RepID=UPI002DDD1A04|nr:hypothetical protein [Aliidongia sp.]HEV2678721.1 hypothetical protein [Aliidongia sp.]